MKNLTSIYGVCTTENVFGDGGRVGMSSYVSLIWDLESSNLVGRWDPTISGLPASSVALGQIVRGFGAQKGKFVKHCFF